MPGNENVQRRRANRSDPAARKIRTLKKMPDRRDKSIEGMSPTKRGGKKQDRNDKVIPAENGTRN